MVTASNSMLPLSWSFVSYEQVLHNLLDFREFNEDKHFGWQWPHETALAKQLIVQIELFLPSVAGGRRGPGPSLGLAGLGSHTLFEGGQPWGLSQLIRTISSGLLNRVHDSLRNNPPRLRAWFMMQTTMISWRVKV